MRWMVWLAVIAWPGARAEAPQTGWIEGSVNVPNAWVWIEGSDGPLPEAPQVHTMSQRGRKFVPDLLVVPTGTVVDFPNFGPEQHNVHWVTPEYTDNLGTYRVGESAQRLFDIAGVYPIGCHRHDNMSATIVVVPNLWFTPVERGRFRLDDITPGTHTVVVWAPGGTEVRSTIEVEAGRGRRVDLDVEVGWVD